MTFIAMVSGFLGSFLILNLLNYNQAVSLIGVFYGLLAALFYSFMHIYAESFLDKIEPLIMTAYVNSFSLMALLIYYRPVYMLKEPPDARIWWAIIALSILAGVLPVALLYTGIKNIGAVKSSIIANFEIPVAALLSYVIYGEKLTLLQMVGMVLVLFGIYFLQVNDDI